MIEYVGANGAPVGVGEGVQHVAVRTAVVREKQQLDPVLCKAATVVELTAASAFTYRVAPTARAAAMTRCSPRRRGSRPRLLLRVTVGEKPRTCTRAQSGDQEGRHVLERAGEVRAYRFGSFPLTACNPGVARQSRIERGSGVPGKSQLLDGCLARAGGNREGEPFVSTGGGGTRQRWTQPRRGNWTQSKTMKWSATAISRK